MEKSLSLHRARWCEPAERALREVASSPVCSIAVRRRAVQENREALFAVTADAEIVGWFVVRVEAMEAADEAVVVAAAGALPGVSLMRSIVPLLDDLAAALGCASLRVHSTRPGMLRELTGLGWQPVETVYRKLLTHETAPA